MCAYASFLLCLLCCSGLRSTTSTFILITAKPFPLPRVTTVVTVPTQGSNWASISPNDVVTLVTSIVPQGSQMASVTQVWTSSNAAVLAGAQTVTMTNITSGTKVTALIIPKFLMPAASSIRFTCVVTTVASSLQQSVSSVVINTNSPPYGGSCSISPFSGVTILTVFNVICPNWVPSAALNAPLTYSLQLMSNNHTASVTILQSAQVSGALSTLLPTNVDASGKMQPLYVAVVITDRFGAAVFSLQTVTVLPPLLSSSMAVASQIQLALNGLTFCVSATNLNCAAQYASSLTGLLAAAAVNFTSSIDIVQRSAARSQAIESLVLFVNASSTNSIAIITQATSVLALVLSVPSEISPTTAVLALSCAATLGGQAVILSNTPFPSLLVSSLLKITANAVFVVDSRPVLIHIFAHFVSCFFPSNFIVFMTYVCGTETNKSIKLEHQFSQSDRFEAFHQHY
jgi:hypothetical protein